MDLPIIDKIQEQARKAESRTREQIKDLRSRGRELFERGGENIKQTAESSRRTLTQAEVQALGTVGEWLDHLHLATGERADWLDRGRSFISQVARDIQLGNLTVDDLPIADYDELNVKKIAANLVDLDAPQRDLIRSYEAANKNRVTVFRTLDRLAEQEALN